MCRTGAAEDPLPASGPADHGGSWPGRPNRQPRAVGPLARGPQIHRPTDPAMGPAERWAGGPVDVRTADHRVRVHRTGDPLGWWPARRTAGARPAPADLWSPSRPRFPRAGGPPVAGPRRGRVPGGGGVRGDRGPDSGPDTGPARCRGRGCGAAGRGVRSRTCPGACQRPRSGSTPVRSHRTRLPQAPGPTPHTPYDLPFPPRSGPLPTPSRRPKAVAGFHGAAMRPPRVRRDRPHPGPRPGPRAGSVPGTPTGKRHHRGT